MKAACIGCRSSGVPSPSIVVTVSPSCITASDRQLLIRRPSTITVQAPHWPWSQPFLVPVRRSEERRVGKSVSVRVDLGGRRIIKKKKIKKYVKNDNIGTDEMFEGRIELVNSSKKQKSENLIVEINRQNDQL